MQKELLDAENRELTVPRLTYPKPNFLTFGQCKKWFPPKKLGGGFKHVLFSPLFGEDSHFD